MIKLHLGCGTVYLQGYINVDAEIPGHYSARSKCWQGIVEKNKTTVDNYYKRSVTREDIMAGTLHANEVAVDLFSSNYGILPIESESVEEIRLVQVFEHFTYEHGAQLLKYWYSLLKPGGILHLDIPDLYETCKQYTQAISLEDKQWYARLLFGSQKNEYGLHRSMYDMPMIGAALDKVGFKRIVRLPNIHFYPAFAVEATK